MSQQPLNHDAKCNNANVDFSWLCYCNAVFWLYQCIFLFQLRVLMCIRAFDHVFVIQWSFFPCSEWYRITCNGVREKWHRPSRRPQLVPTGAENHLSSDGSHECWGDMFAWAAAWTQCEGLHKRLRWVFNWICLQGCCKQTLYTSAYNKKKH